MPRSVPLAVSIACIALAFPVAALAQATVETDRLDYSPGDTVTVTGSGFTDSPKVGSVTVGVQVPASLCPGDTATFLVEVGRGSGSGSPGSFDTDLSITTALPAGTGWSFSPNPVSFAPGDRSKTTTLTLTTSGSTPSGPPASLTVKAERTSADFTTGDGALTVTDGPPVITLLGDNPLTLECSDAFVEPGGHL